MGNEDRKAPDMDTYAQMLSLSNFLREPTLRSAAPFGEPRTGCRMRNWQSYLVVGGGSGTRRACHRP